MIIGNGSIVFHTSSNGFPSKAIESVIRGITITADESNNAPEVRVRQTRKIIADMMVNLCKVKLRLWY
jgi:hypothetical protein